MTILHNINRRCFIGTATAATGGLLLPTTRLLGLSKSQPSGEFSSTDHFWYRKPPDSPYIDSQRGSRAFSFSENALFLSEDNSHTWTHSAAFPEARNITFSHIFENGNILFATQAKIFLSSDNLRSYREIILKNPDGMDYVPHTPQNPDNPGWYFHTLTGVDSWRIGGVEMLVWGNYSNVIGGATPSNIYYSTDSGQTVKIAYSFGQNPYFCDNGSEGGGPSGMLLGNPNNPVFCRHVHSVAYNPEEKAFYACTGDGDRPKGLECHWLRGTYDTVKDSWNWKVIISEKLNSRYKSGGISFVDGQLYWISDANGPEPYDRGIFRCDPADIANPKKHTMLFNPKYESGMMIIQDGVILATHIAVASPFTLGIIISPDMGKTWSEYDLKEFGPRSPSRIHQKNAEGWFRLDLRTGWITRKDVLFIKPK
jgi:hypothetical protein